MLHGQLARKAQTVPSSAGVLAPVPSLLGVDNVGFRKFGSQLGWMWMISALQ